MLHAISQAWAAAYNVNDNTVADFLDEILGDSNTDSLTGGAGADLFIINTDDNITDFKFLASRKPTRTAMWWSRTGWLRHKFERVR